MSLLQLSQQSNINSAPAHSLITFNNVSACIKQSDIWTRLLLFSCVSKICHMNQINGKQYYYLIIFSRSQREAELQGRGKP